MNDILERPMQTPIEIALGIDEKGMTTASKLYEFLELSQSNYSKWCKANITENEFAEENVDFIRFVIKYESGVGLKEREDYKLTSHFAKKLSVKGNGERAEQAREYFSTLDDKVKQVAIDRSMLSPQMQMFYTIADGQARVELEQQRQAEQLSQIADNQTAISLALTGDKEEDFKHWVKRCLSAIAESGKFQYDGTRSMIYQAVYAESYKRLNDKRPCRLDQRVNSEKGRAFRNGASKTAINSINKLYIIEHDKDLKPAYELVVKEMMAQYCVKVN